jgi:hypothetical protein
LTVYYGRRKASSVTIGRGTILPLAIQMGAIDDIAYYFSVAGMKIDEH